MQDSFRVRADKVFGTLGAFSAANSSSPSLSSSLWCLTDEEIKRNEWNRSKDDDDDDEGLGANSYHPDPEYNLSNKQQFGTSTSQGLNNPWDFHRQLDLDLESCNEGGGGNEEGFGGLCRELAKSDDHNDQEFDIRYSIGVDSTLDREEEEDEYDKVAVVRENASDILYMRDVAGYGIDIETCSELPNSFRDAARDPRANHIAAKIRLQEDAEAAAKLDSLVVSDANEPPSLDNQTGTLDDGTNLKSILKKRESQMDYKFHKRVRFEQDSYGDRKKAKDTLIQTGTMGEAATVSNDASNSSALKLHDSTSVPNYIRNPSKYTHYTFDSSSDIDEESNREAYEDFINLLKSRKAPESQPDEMSIDLPKSVIFTPKKRINNVSNVKLTQEEAYQESTHRNANSNLISIAAGEIQESEVSAMDEDDLDGNMDKGQSIQRRARLYRAKTTENVNEHS